MMKKKLMVLCSILLSVLSMFTVVGSSMVLAEEKYEPVYSKLSFASHRITSNYRPSNAEEMEELFAIITDYKVVPSNGMYVDIKTVTGEEKYIVFPYGELTTEYLHQLVADETISSIVVGHDERPVDVGGAEQTGDSAVYAVITLCTATAALTSLVVLRKKRI